MYHKPSGEVTITGSVTGKLEKGEINYVVGGEV